MKKLKKLSRHRLFPLFLGIPLLLLALLTERLAGQWWALPLYIAASFGSGYRVYAAAIRGIIRRDPFDEKLLMSIASVGAIIIGERAEGAAVMLFYLVGEYLEHLAITRSRASIRSLMDIRPDTARVLSEGEWELTDAEDVSVGAKIMILSGERVPLDCRITEGEAELDTSALTGEAQPRPVRVGDEISSGTVVLGGRLICEALRDADSSAAARIMELVEEATERKSRTESFISSFARVYTPIVTVLALLMAVVPPLFSLLSWGEAVYRALSFLVVSCPCALVISVPMAFFGGIGGAASHGILYKGANTFSALSRVKTVVFDKTGTLTTGELRVAAVIPDGVTEERLSLLAASLERYSLHPVARGISALTDSYAHVTDLAEIAGQGVTGYVDGSLVGVGSIRLMATLGATVPDTALGAGRVFVAENGRYVGAILLTDRVRSEAGEAISRLRALGVEHTCMLSGDSAEACQTVGDSLSLDEVHAELLPEGKYRELETLLSREGSLLYIGDGINDAPCLARADVGVAMGASGSDSAIEAADAAIMSDNLLRLPECILIARRTLAIARENIVFCLGVKMLVLLLVALDLGGMSLAVFADVGVCVLAILNSMRALRLPKKAFH